MWRAVASKFNLSYARSQQGQIVGYSLSSFTGCFKDEEVRTSIGNCVGIITYYMYVTVPILLN